MKIAVIGLGIAGLSISARLAEAGHDVRGFEQFALMHANGSSHGDTRIIRLTPGEGEAYVRLAERAAPLWTRWEQMNGAPLLRWTGGLMCGPPGSPFVAMCGELSAQHGRAAARLDACDLDGVRLPADWEIVRQADCGVVYADAARALLIRHAQANGARLHAGVRIDAPIDATSLSIDGETQSFDAVIVSAGAWIARLAPRFAPMLSVKRRVLGWLKPTGARVDIPVLCVDDASGLYGMPTPDGLYKIGLHAIGDTVDPDDVADPNADDALLLRDAAARYLPQHDPEPVRMARCLYTLTPDQNFLIAEAAPRVLVVSCCSGHGFKYAPACGEIALDWIEGREAAELAAFGPARGQPATPLGGAPSPRGDA